MQVGEKEPVTSGFKYLRGRVDLFYIFKEQRSRDYAQQALNFFLHNAKRYDSVHPVFRRVTRNLYGKNMEALIEHFFINPENHQTSEYKTVDFEYLRILEGSYVDLVEPVGTRILRVITRIERTMQINPFTRFFVQFNGYIGNLSRSCHFFSPNGKLTPKHQGIAGLRQIEKVLLNSFNEEIDDLTGNYLDLVNLFFELIAENKFIHQDEILLVLLSKELDRKIFLKAIHAINDTNMLLPFYQKQEGWRKKEIRFRLEEEQIKSLYEKPKSIAHPEYPAIDTEGVKEELKKIFHKRKNYEVFLNRLATTMFRVRENTYSKKTRAPGGYIATMVYTTPGDDGRNAIILPGQEPLAIKPVASNQQIKEDHPLGSVFVVWISKETINTKSYVYQSKNKNLFYIKIHH